MKHFSFKLIIAIFSILSLVFLTACGGGGGGSNNNPVPTTNITITTPGDLFEDVNASFRRSQTIATFTVTATPWSNGSQVSGGNVVSVMTTYENGKYTAKFSGLNTSYDYRFSAMFNEKELLSNMISLSDIVDGANFNLDLISTLKTIVYETWRDKTKISDKSMDHFLDRCKEDGLKTGKEESYFGGKLTETSIGNYKDDYKDCILAVTKGESEDNLPKPAVTVKDIKENITFILSSDEGNIVSDKSYKLRPTFTVIASPSYNFSKSEKNDIAKAVNISDVDSSFWETSWSKDGTSLSLTVKNDLAYEYEYTVFMNEVDGIFGVNVIPFKNFDFTTVKEGVIDYSIEYNLNGGTLEKSNPTSYNKESAEITLNNPTKSGYEFTGWTGTDLNSKTITVTIKQGSKGNRSYTANWKKL